MEWFTADEHFRHKNIIQYANRPFGSQEEMHDILIQRHNSVVKPTDVVYHLGDFSFGDPTPFAKQLNGRHILIRGNHDSSTLLKNYGPFALVRDVHSVKIGDRIFFLSHYAHRVWNRSHYGTMHLYGHSHGTLPGRGRSMDVGVDTHEFRPYSSDEIYERLRHIDPLQVDHHAVAFANVLF